MPIITALSVCCTLNEVNNTIRHGIDGAHGSYLQSVDRCHIATKGNQMLETLRYFEIYRISCRYGRPIPRF